MGILFLDRYICWRRFLVSFLLMIIVSPGTASTRTAPIALARTRRRIRDEAPRIPSNSWVAAQRTISVFDPKVRSVFYGDDDSNDDDRHGQSPGELNATPKPTPNSTTSNPSPPSKPTKFPSLSTSNPSRAPRKSLSPSSGPSRYPTTSPSSEPSRFPTYLSTEKLTGRPSTSPTLFPSETLSESSWPSSNPTKHPSIGPSSRLTRSPTSFPTSKPTRDFSTYPSSQPTFSPTAYPSRSPTSIIITSSQRPTSCEDITSTGNFGDTSFDPIILNYAYNIETDASSKASMDEEIIPSLEMTMVKFVIARTFSASDCLIEGRRLQPTHRSLESMVGISSLPNDKSTPQDCADSSIDTKCTSVEGRMSLYLTQLTASIRPRISEPAQKMESVVLETIKMGMEGDKFLNAHISIQKVIFIGTIDYGGIDYDDDGLLRSGDDDREQRDLGGDDVLGVGIFIGIFAFLSLILLTVAMTRRRLSRSRTISEPGVLGLEVSGSDDGVLGSEVDGDDIHYIEPWAGALPNIDGHHVNPHDESTVRVANRGGGGGSEDFPVGDDVDSRNRDRDALFDFFDLILENSIETRGVSESRPRSMIAHHDDLSEISF